MPDFVHLHCHSEYSALDGGSRVSDMPEVLKELGMKHMALTDHGVMQGLSEFQDTLTEEGINPILGLESYFADDRFNKKAKTFHLTLIAMNDTGYRNLCKISSFAFIEGLNFVFGNPRARADWDLLDRYSEGIICLTGCMAGPVMGEIMGSGDFDLAYERTKRLVDIFGADNVYGEIQNVGIAKGIPGDSSVAKMLGKEPLDKIEAARLSGKDLIEEGEVSISQTEANMILVEHICRPLNLKYVATGDVHYLREDDADPHDALICIPTKQQKNGERRFSLLPSKYHLRSYKEMLAAVPEYPESLAETVNLAERCDARIQYDRELLPEYPVPENEGTSGDYLRKLCLDGMERLYPESNPFRDEAVERLEMELGVISSMGFNDYFLIVWDLFHEAVKRGIPYGPGRGSAAGSIVSYTLAITHLCPLEEDLLFERFLNPDRKSMPDIDMDFGVKEKENGEKLRDELIRYAFDKYNNHAGCSTAVSQIVTFGKFKAKGALRDSARVLAEPSEEGKKKAQRDADRLAKTIPDDPRATMRSVWEDKKEGKQLRDAYENSRSDQAIIKQAGWMEGLIRNNGIHAAAVIIASHDLTDDLPLQKLGDGNPLTVQYDMVVSERLGLLKMDFLGLKTLDVIWDAIKLVKETRGVDLGDPYRDIPRDDPATYEMLAAGKSVGTFQLESGGMSSALTQIKPTEFDDLTAIVALYRPGPMAHIPTYAARKNGRADVEYLDPRLEDILGSTYGICIYQEQSMRIARDLAGFTPGQADDLRKAIGKKLKDKMEALRPPYLKGCQENGLTKKHAETLWADNEAAADYSFNKSHAACYALLAFVTSYLKANFPEEYFAALMASVIADKDRLRQYLTEAKQTGVKVLPPDINRSEKLFNVSREEDGDGLELLFGLTAIKGISDQTVASLVDEREKGPFKSVYELIERQPKLSGKVLAHLAEGGALDNLPGSRKAVAEIAEKLVEENKKRVAASEKAFVNDIKVWLKKNPRPDDQVTAKGIRKLTPLETQAINAGTLMLARGGDDDLTETCYEGIRKKRMSQARKALRDELEEKESGIGSISNEDQDEGDPVEDEAVRIVDGEKDQNRQLASEVAVQIEAAREAVEKEQAENQHLFALEQESQPQIPSEEWTDEEKLLTERRRLGIYVTGHPLDRDKRKWAYYVDKGLGLIDSTLVGRRIRVCGAVVQVETKPIRSGLMCKVTLEDLTGAREITLWPDVYEIMKDVIEEGKVLVFEASVKEDSFAASRQEESGDEADDMPVQLFGVRAFNWKPETIEVPDNVQDAGSRATLTVDELEPGTVEDLQALSGEHPGDIRLFVKVGDEDPVRTSLKFAAALQVKEALAKFGDIRGIDA